MILQVYILKKPLLFTDTKLSDIQKYLVIFSFISSFFSCLSSAQKQEHRSKLRKMTFFYFQHDQTGCVRMLGTPKTQFCRGWFLPVTLLGFLQEFVLLLHSLIALPSKKWFLIHTGGCERGTGLSFPVWLYWGIFDSQGWDNLGQFHMWALGWFSQLKPCY